MMMVVSLWGYFLIARVKKVHLFREECWVMSYFFCKGAVGQIHIWLSDLVG